MNERDPTSAGAPDRAKRVRRTFVRHVFEWLALGYGELNSSEFATTEEEDITGELVRAMRDVVKQPDAPPWLDHLSVHEEAPQNVTGRHGKKRPRLDMEFERVERGERPHFGMQAKRLYRSDSVAEYLGAKGLGCFLAGDYASGQLDGGMVGYVQNRSETDWATRLADKLSTESAAYALCPGTAWEDHTLTRDLAHMYRTEHDRQEPNGRLTVFHILLRFH